MRPLMIRLGPLISDPTLHFLFSAAVQTSLRGIFKRKVEKLCSAIRASKLEHLRRRRLEAIVSIIFVHPIIYLWTPWLDRVWQQGAELSIRSRHDLGLTGEISKIKDSKTAREQSAH